ncbi:MAG: hypothetical protein ACOX4N_00770 [Dethiobacteraceae bacterium]|jgi:hypothetical protein|nr:hypothetical protein [Bacillota bacterium]
MIYKVSVLLPLLIYLVGSAKLEPAAAQWWKQKQRQYIYHYLIIFVACTVLGFFLILFSLSCMGKVDPSYLELVLTLCFTAGRILLSGSAARLFKTILYGDKTGLSADSSLGMLLFILFVQLIALNGYPLVLDLARLTLSVLIIRTGFSSGYLYLSACL